MACGGGWRMMPAWVAPAYDENYRQIPPNEFREEYGNIYDELRELKRMQGLAEFLLQDRLKALQARCPHEHTLYIPDASGNNDSSLDCCDCGKSLR